MRSRTLHSVATRRRTFIIRRAVRFLCSACWSSSSSLCRLLGLRLSRSRCSSARCRFAFHCSSHLRRFCCCSCFLRRSSCSCISAARLFAPALASASSSACRSDASHALTIAAVARSASSRARCCSPVSLRAFVGPASASASGILWCTPCATCSTAPSPS